jgi:hypothetical protein
MHKTILMLLLVFVSSGVMAEWVEVGVNDYIGSTFYADTETISKSGNRVKMWVMYDYKTAHDVGDNFGKYMSTRSHNEYDCKEAQMRVTYQARFSKNMGKGKKEVETAANFDWYSVVPGTHDELLWKIACGK